MKNRIIEQRKRTAKRLAKCWNRAVNAAGNHIPHCYSEEEKTSFGWWDDLSFKLGSQIVAVWWIHPRQHYHNLCYEQLDIELSYPKEEDSIDDWLKPVKTNYKKLGKSRKKVISYQMATPSEKNKAFWQKRDECLKKILDESEIIAKPYISVYQYNWDIGVELCLPMEVVDEDSVNKLADITKNILRHETSLKTLYPNYIYTKNNWQQEGHSQSLKTHLIK